MKIPTRSTHRILSSTKSPESEPILIAQVLAFEFRTQFPVSKGSGLLDDQFLHLFAIAGLDLQVVDAT